MLRPNFDLNAALPLTAADRLKMSGRLVVFEPGQALFQQGDACAGICRPGELWHVGVAPFQMKPGTARC